jgi:hypothetical protein
MSRRDVVATGAVGIAAGVFASRVPAAFAHEGHGDATPIAASALGYVSIRVRTISEAGNRDDINGTVLDTFVLDVQELDGYEGYVLGDVIEDERQSLSIVVLEEADQAEAFDALAQEFVGSLGEVGQAVETSQWAGDLLIAGAPTGTSATPVASSAVMSDGYVALRVHTSKPGTDPRDFVDLATEGFLPIVQGLPGFKGYLWYPTEGGFVAVTLYDSVESAEESNAAAKEWAAEFLPEYTDGNPEIYNANVVYADLPVLARV